MPRSMPLVRLSGPESMAFRAWQVRTSRRASGWELLAERSLTTGGTLQFAFRLPQLPESAVGIDVETISISAVDVQDVQDALAVGRAFAQALNDGLVGLSVSCESSRCLPVRKSTLQARRQRRPC